MTKNKQGSSSSYIRSLLKWMIGTLIMSVLIIVGLFRVGNISSWADEAGGSAAILEGTLGIAVAFAGALVAIRIAQSANDTIKFQEHRETIQEATHLALSSSRQIAQIRIGFEELIVIVDEVYRYISERFQEDRKEEDEVMIANENADDPITSYEGLLSRLPKNIKVILGNNKGNIADNSDDIFNWIRNDDRIKEAMLFLDKGLKNQSILLKKYACDARVCSILDTVKKRKHNEGWIFEDTKSMISNSLFQLSFRTEQVVYYLLLLGAGCEIKESLPKYIDKSSSISRILWALRESFPGKEKSSYDQLVYEISKFTFGADEFKDALKNSVLSPQYYPNDECDVFFESYVANRIMNSGRYSKEMQCFLDAKVNDSIGRLSAAS